uniref:Uncharacterized protein n=1 Tax=Meloidogyne enterolobii TaxID=390850 RepID=A0A6V7URZ9_MELEN|nr:unnamed protein product [Meloidogyne enterolobii]
MIFTIIIQRSIKKWPILQKTILNSNVRMILYYGDLDMICNFLIGQRFTEQLGFEFKNTKTSLDCKWTDWWLYNSI